MGRQRDLPAGLAGALDDYRTALTRADLSPAARRAYASRVAGFLDWLATGGHDLTPSSVPGAGTDPGTPQVDPLTEQLARDYAVRDYRSWLKTVRKAPPQTINGHLTALDHFYGYHLGLGSPVITRERLSQTAPESLDSTEQRRFIRACGRESSRNAAAGLLLLYTGLRVAELAALDVEDMPMSARRGRVIVRDGKGGVYREVPLHHAARAALRKWLDERPAHRGATDTSALLLSRRGQRMGVRALRYVIAELGQAAGLVTPPLHPHVLRHTFATQLLRNGVDIVVVADLLGHATLDTTRAYTRSSEADRDRAIETALIADE